MINNKNHQKLVDDILFAIGSRPDVRLWIRAVGYDREKRIKYGMKGESDIQGIIAPIGRMLCIECKTGSGKLSKEQILFRDMVVRFGALYIEARNLEQTLTELESKL